MKIRAFLKKVIGISALSLIAQSSLLAKEIENIMSVGVGTFYNEAPYVAWDEDEIIPIPLFAYKKGNFYFDGIDVGYTLLVSEGLTSGYYVDLIGSAQVGLGYKSEDSIVFKGMEDRNDIAFGTGFKLGYYNMYGLIELQATQDVANAHQGLVGDLTYSLPLGDEAQGIQVVPYVGLSYQSDKFNDYYYGVKDSEAQLNRLAYKAKADTNVFAGVSLIYMMSPKWTFTMNAEYKKLGDEVKNSPIVAQDNIVSGFIGVSYTL